MMKDVCFSALAMAAISALGLGGSAAQGATASATVTARILQQAAITKTSDLDYATIVPASTASTVIVAPVTGTRVCGAGLVCTGTATAARFSVAGTLGQLVTVSVPANVTLTSGSHTMTSTLLSSLVAPITLLATNEFTVGGTLAVGADQVDGVYTGTFTATVDYQ